MSCKYSLCSGLTSVITMIENPFSIAGRASSSRTFDVDIFYTATLYVPKGTLAKYMGSKGWQDFVYIEELGTTTNMKKKALPVLIQAEGGEVSVDGAPEGTRIAVYDASGVKLGSAVSRGGKTLVPTRIASSSIAIVKIGERSFKVAMK